MTRALPETGSRKPHALGEGAAITLLPSMTPELRQTAVFAAGHYLPRLITLLALPFYTRLLAPSAFALVAFAEMLLAFAAMAANAGLSSALMRFHIEQRSEVAKDRVFITALLLALTTGIIVSGTIVIAAAVYGGMPVLGQAVEPDALMRWAVALAVIAICDAANELVITLFRVRSHAAGFLAQSMVRVILAVAIALYLIGVRGFELDGYLIGHVAASLTCLLCFGGWQAAKHWTRPTRSIGRQLLRYSVPFIPLGFLETLAAKTGFICLSAFGSASMLAQYAVAERLAAAVSFAYGPLSIILTPFMLRVHDRDDAPETFARIGTMLCLSAGLVVVAVSGFADELVTLVGGAAYLPAAAIVLPLSLASCCASLRPSMRIGLTATKNTHLLPTVAAAASGLGLAVTWILTGPYGLEGAAWGTAITALLSLVLSGYISQRFLRVPFEWRQIGAIVAVAICVLVVLQVFPLTALTRTLIITACGGVTLLLIQFLLKSTPLLRPTTAGNGGVGTGAISAGDAR